MFGLCTRPAHKHAYYMIAVKFNAFKGQDDIRTLLSSRVNRKIEFVQITAHVTRSRCMHFVPHTAQNDVQCLK